MTIKFGAIVKAERERQGLTRSELARRCCYADGHEIADVERDDRGITTNRMERIAKGLGCDLVIQLVPRTDLVEAIARARDILVAPTGNK